MKQVITNDVSVNPIMHVIYERRSVRKYLPDMVDDDIIEKIIDAGRMAPSAMNGQPWKFYIVTHKDTIASFSKEIAKIASRVILKTAIKHPIETIKTLLHFSSSPLDMNSEHAIFHDAPIVIFITGPRNSEWARLDIGMCAQNMMLAAKSLGLDSCPVGLAKYIEKTPVFYKLEVPTAEEVHLAIIIGYGNEKPKPQSRIKNNTLFVDRMECC
ncbi:nitroreductase [Pedobacter gandavensis]|uniref:nitroreductase n=1 Tax=Pedobacter gandavensis TaxID=2679963 RepID=UPI00247AAF71|nr:nitroreductase [Pedobacter gandavensis]WGQ09853.1 nitroreductase [Pedobacter gandavensis]